MKWFNFDRESCQSVRGLFETSRIRSIPKATVNIIPDDGIDGSVTNLKPGISLSRYFARLTTCIQNKTLLKRKIKPLVQIIVIIRLLF